MGVKRMMQAKTTAPCAPLVRIMVHISLGFRRWEMMAFVRMMVCHLVLTLYQCVRVIVTMTMIVR